MVSHRVTAFTETLKRLSQNMHIANVTPDLGRLTEDIMFLEQVAKAEPRLAANMTKLATQGVTLIEKAMACKCRNCDRRRQTVIV